MAELWAAAVQLAFDCDPTWTTECEPSVRTPTAWDLRQAEISDLRHQGTPLIGIHRATTIHAPEYL